MKISAKMSIIMSAIFAGVCFSVAITGFIQTGDLADAQQRSDGYGFAWFWTFLGVIGLLFGALGVWIVRTAKEEA